MKEKTIRNTSPEQFQQEFECEFLGSVNTLISPAKIKNMGFIQPIQSNESLSIYEQPKKCNICLLCRCCKSVTKDYSHLLL